LTAYLFALSCFCPPDCEFLFVFAFKVPSTGSAISYGSETDVLRSTCHIKTLTCCMLLTDHLISNTVACWYSHICLGHHAGNF
jgi:hypothetical protein